MPAVAWDQIPERVKPKLERAQRENFFSEPLRWITDEPAKFVPEYEAVELQSILLDDFQIEYDPIFYVFRQAPSKALSFGYGRGFESVPKEFRPVQPIKIAMSARDGGELASLPAILICHNPAVLVLSESLFTILNSIEHVASNRVLRAEARADGRGAGEKYYLIDPPCIEDIVDIERSSARWGINSEGQWTYTLRTNKTAFRRDRVFHLARYQGGAKIAISKDLLFTLYERVSNMPGRYFDPHKLIYGHTYYPKRLDKIA